LPKIDFLETNNRISAIHTKRDEKAVNATHAFSIKRPTDFIPLLQQEFSLEIPTRILNVKPSTLVSTLYTVYTAQYFAAQTKTTVTNWLSKFLEINKLTAQILSPLQVLPFMISSFFPTLNILSNLKPLKTFLSLSNRNF
jgi:hypothetical protein